MAGKQRPGVIISLEARRRRRREEALAEANRQMIEAEHALFVALRLVEANAISRQAGRFDLRKRVLPATPAKVTKSRLATLATVVRFRTRRQRAA
jgi:hypothetical protein